MAIPVGLNVFSGLVGATMPYLDATVAPYESIWMPDHVQYANRNVAEGWSLLVYALARYEDKICGHQVLCNSFRNPAHLAKMAATCQTLSGGRVVLGIGAGWNEEEYHAYGWPFPSNRVRIEQLAEAIQICRAMWSDTPVTFSGKHYQLQGAYCEPRPEPAPRSWWGAQAKNSCCAWLPNMPTGGITSTRRRKPMRISKTYSRNIARRLGATTTRFCR